MPRPILEICVDDPQGLAVACANGAERIELCAALAVGGLTPAPGLIALARDCGVPCHAMIRPRPGGFVYTPDELRAMQADIAAVQAAGLPGIVTGVSLPDGQLDRDAMARLRDASNGQATVHRAFDLAPDPFAALNMLVDLGFDRILTSGGAATAVAGADRIAALVQAAGGRIEIMPGGAVDTAAVPLLLPLGVDALHASCARMQPEPHHLAPLNLPPQRAMTDGSAVAALARAMAQS
ncbi:MAG: copper homeostasis protein CutC [Paracoccus sp. (in: a-proteobacteria)]|uniref:copper homeostasis protein CutC n=1 Tax=Paracoccus sp. TaxID=267 RepID=UPI0026E02D93|nr:copper homeostasis protein CutC [Paracoccus sp. (in: a-proteobacteria)]MDO5611714.1 copper homeostasis protein CutC [Paracoccus sp. (in: a-proteobacteria)]